MDKLISKNLIYAVVGASNNREKYGNKVFRDLLSAGYKTFAVNLKENLIEGEKAYKILKDVPKKIDVVVFVIPPTATETVLQEVKDLKINNVWMQPGSESDEAIKFCEDNNINCIHDACIMVIRRFLENS